MVAILSEIWGNSQMFFLVLVRMAGLFLMSPVFGRQNVPLYFKLGLSLILSYMVYIARFMVSEIALSSFIDLGILILREVLVGFSIGFITTLLFSAVLTAGQLIDAQIGFGIVNVIDPQSSIQVPMMGNFKNILTLIVFFVLDGHHNIIKILFYSYDIVPLEGSRISAELGPLMAKLFSSYFGLAIRIALPIVAITFLSEVAFGILVRTVPQMNIFIIGIPVKLFIGLIAILIFIPIYIGSLGGIFEGLYQDIGRILGGLVGQ